MTEEIRPRTLDMTRSPNDPNDMSLSPMNLASAGGISPSAFRLLRLLRLMRAVRPGAQAFCGFL